MSVVYNEYSIIRENKDTLQVEFDKVESLMRRSTNAFVFQMSEL